jgi:predicted HTH domain antitoxin
MAHVPVVSLNIPHEALMALKLSPDAAEREIVLVAAVKLFEVGRLCAGAAALLAGLPKPVFMTKLVDYGVPVFRLVEGDVARDAQNG